MEKDETTEDRFLRELIQTSPLECPSDDFVEKVMAGVIAAAPVESSQRSFYHYLRSALPYIGLTAMVLMFVYSSDLPFSKLMPGIDYWSRYVIPYFDALVGGFKSLFATRFVTFAMGIGLCAGLLVLIEHFFSHRKTINHPAA